jgi:hypothetical protein
LCTNRHRAADPHKGSGIQGAYQLRLGLEVHVRHFVEKQGTAGGLFQTAILDVALALAAK